MITGIYVGLESPSWKGAMMVLDSMVTDKVEFCKKYEIEIYEWEWPSHHLPECIIADRGEFESTSPENLINNFGITIENTSPYRGDMKGIVERLFRSINARIESSLPGAVLKDYRKRGDEDYRLNARLTLTELTKLVIHMVLVHNSTQIEKYDIQPDMLGDNVMPIPTKIWEWGIQNRKGNLRIVDRTVFRMCILPRGKASITRGAIKFKGLYYRAPEMIENRMFQNNKIHTVLVVYDPRNIKNIYVPKEDKSFVTFTLDERSIVYVSYTLEDVIEANQQKNKLHKNAEDISLERDMQLDLELKKVAKYATKEAGKSTKSKAERVRNIKQNREEEKAVQSEKEGFIPEKPMTTAKVLTMNGKEVQEIKEQMSYEEEQLAMISRILEGKENDE